MNTIQRIALVGHCGFDASSLRRFVEMHAPDQLLIEVNNEVELTQIAAPDTLMLINRVLDGAFSTDTGIDLIERLMKAPHPPRAMLVSNYEDAQAAAEKAGAKPGFGKGQLRDAEAVERLKNTLV